LMTDDIEDCLIVVVKAVEKSNLPPKVISKWCDEMLASDRIGVHCDDEIKELKKRH